MFYNGENNNKTSFDTLKQKIINALVFVLPNLETPFEVEIDASDYVMGAILVQEGKPSIPKTLVGLF